VLVAVLWAVVLATVIVASIAQDSRLETRICLAGGEAVRGKWALRAGVEKAIAILNDDLKTSDSLDDLWSDNEDELFDVELGQATFDIRIIDEASKLNINTASKKRLLGLENMTEEIADAIIDWRDKNDDTSPGGAEEGYYLNLPYGYRIRNGPFRTLRELLLVKGVTTELLYGEDTNLNGLLDYNEKDGDENPPSDDGDDVLDAGWIDKLTCYSYDINQDAGGNGRVNINEADEKKLAKSLNISQSCAKWIVQNRKNKGYKSIGELITRNSPERPSKQQGRNSGQAAAMDLETFANIADKITVTNDKTIPGRVNINTAPKEVLTALLDGDAKLAENIISYRSSLAGGMVSIADVMKADSISIDVFKKIANEITTRCSVFMVRSLAKSERTGAVYQSEAVIDRASRPAVILYQYMGANN